jgi:O-Antigen ligase
MITRSISAAVSFVDHRTAPADLARPGVRSGWIVATTAYVGVCALAIVAPFELLRPLVRLPWQSVSDVEGVLAVVFCAWLWSIVWSGTWPRWHNPLTYPWMILLAVMIVSAAMAPTERVNALHMAGRLTIGFGVFLLTVTGISTPARLRGAMAAAVLAGVVVGVLTVLEYLQVKPVVQGLRAFRPAVAAVGGQLRAGGTLQYPTIDSMYLEIVFALGLGLLLRSASTKNLKSIIAVFLGLVVVAEAITLTFTRAGLVTMALSLGLIGTVRYARRGADAAVRLVAVLACLIPIMLAASRSTQSMWLRLTSDGQDAWYRFAVDAPRELTFTTGGVETVPIRATNKGRLTWDSEGNPPVYFSYHWLLTDTDRVIAVEGLRTSFARPVPPGTTTTLHAQVRAPRQPGRYRLEWDLVEEDRLWFSTEPEAGMPPLSGATVTGPLTDDRLTTYALPLRAVRPSRLFLWRAAARMAIAHPLLGVGPDNFRLLYGGYAGLPHADPRLHSNNMYIEMMAGGGLGGGLAFLWLVWRTMRRAVAAIRPATTAIFGDATLGVAAAVIAVLIHGTVDSFLSFTPTYVLISITLGFVVASTRGPGCGAIKEGQAATNADCL